MDRSPNILICPLEWGLGHAARMIPVAEKLRSLNCNVIIGAGKEHLALFRSEIPGISTIEFPGFRPAYSKRLPQYLYLLFKIPSLVYHGISEHRKLGNIIKKYHIDIVISDNRFGLWNRNVKSFYITHQPRIPFPPPFRMFEFIGTSLHRAVMRRYRFCFIPDLPGELNLTGRLSHGMRLPGNTSFMGILSKFICLSSQPKDASGIFRHNTVILSGPEPQRGILMKKLTDMLKGSDPFTVILGGRPGSFRNDVNTGNIIYHDHLPAAEMKKVIAGSDKIITRAGYTAIMELVSLNKTALLVPTPGQTEQEYLARYLQEIGWFTYISQKDLADQIPEIRSTSLPSEEIINKSKLLFEEAIMKILENQEQRSQNYQAQKKA